MKKTSEPVVFFGSGPVAAASLELLERDFIIEAVVTKPKATHHRGSAPVIELTTELGLPLIEAANKDDLTMQLKNRKLKSKLAILIDFGIIVPRAVIDYFPLGIVNSHFSLLPQWRGADPITFAILSGQEFTGVSLMLLVEKMDEGPLLSQAAYDIPPTITAPELTEELITLSHQALNKVIPLYFLGQVQPAEQSEVSLAPDKTPTYSRKLTKQDGALDWNKPAIQLDREIRAYLEWPKSYTTLGSVDVVITRAHPISGQAKPGEVVVEGFLLSVGCTEGLLVIDELKPSGKPAMNSAAFLAGYRDRLENSIK